MNVRADSRTAPRRRNLSRLASAGRDEDGAIAVLFAVVLMLLTPLVLGVFDIYIANRQRAQVQDALDAATLYAAKSSADTTVAVDAAGRRMFAANLKLMPGSTLTTPNFVLEDARVTGTATFQPAAFAPAFFTHAPVVVRSEVLRGMDRFEIVLVLDTTGSMQGTKLSTLKTAAKNLVDQLQVVSAASLDPTPLKIALVPFSNTVRVQATTSLAAYDASGHAGPGVPGWIDPLGRSRWNAATNGDILENAASPGTYVDRLAMMKAVTVGGAPLSWSGCVESRAQPYDVSEAAADPAIAASMFIPYFWPDEADATNAGYNNYMIDPAAAGLTWLQKQRRASKYAGAQANTGAFSLDSSAYGTGYVLGPNAGCVLQPVIRLTTDFVAVKSGIDAMTAIGETNIPMGLAWGWHAVSPIGPYADGGAYGTPHLRKIVILMTDGENTMNNPAKSAEQNGSFYGAYGYIWQGILGMTSGSAAARTDAINGRLALLCANVKARNIVLYTVRVEVASGSSSLLQTCASDPDKFFDVQDVADLNAVFEAIAASIGALRIAR